MNSPRFTAVSAACLALHVAACQPEKPPGGADETTAATGTDGNSETGNAGDDTTTGPVLPTTSGPGDTAPTSDSDPESTNSAATNDTGDTTDPPDPTGSDPACGGPGEHQPPGPLVALGPADPDAIDAYGGEFGGRFSVTASRHAEDADWQMGAFASFYDVPPEIPSAACVVELDPVTGADDCGVRWSGGFGWGGGELQPRSVGAATLLGPGWSEPMLMGPPPLLYYDADILGLGHPLAWGETFGVAWTGDRLPAGELPQFVTLPAELTVSTPADVVWTFGGGPFELAWTGTGAPPLRLFAQFVPPTEGSVEWFELVCKIADDGSFTVPAEVVAMLPPGWSGVGELRRAVASTAEAADRNLLGEAVVAIELQVAVAP